MEIAEKSPQQQFEGNPTMSAAIALWELHAHKVSDQITFIMDSSAELPYYPLTSPVPDNVDRYINNPPKICANP
jgi:hypothetical protein